MKKFVLASGSPRRKELLSEIIPEFEIIPAKGEEVIKDTDPAMVVESLSKQKCEEIFHKILTNEGSDIVVIGADTVVSYNQKILGKPCDKADARRMISDFQGDVHQVYTGVTIMYVKDSSEQSFTFHVRTDVEVYDMTDEEIESYISTDEPYDKAGGYGIQGLFGVYVKGIRGDYNNVVGLPVSKLFHECKRLELI
ncbi:MAG: Maf family protein [Butyrivibrio sp.]|nr:Maf family protein [Butyrivibrio sp.]